ncbi:HAD family hydrolase [Streptomyces zagrosensis]|uniref:HAD superfamily hydrolase (TIGR01509 family) n=1 Tax=Streptomyces zagrosensis TaxID=1042984 RepID=A0A7W9V0E4_9ACTN|nr:HAD family hydrolase [Streptomyces zagrosensis]MBB5937727.1 HAD superfamily hydrolase (TIGR01509 family) [Streptomyces zagrosensis]
MTPSTEAARAALFDMDGTLVDTNYLHAVTWWESFRQAGITVPMPDIHRSIGMGGDRLLDHLLGADRDRSQDESITAAHTALYAAYFPTLAPLPGAADLLRAMADRGWRVVVASSAGGDELVAMRNAIGADEAIADAISGDDVEHTKPAPDLVQEAVRRSGAPADRSLFVGDTVWDMQACAAAGVRCVGLLSGGIPRSALEAAGAVAVYDGPSDLLAHLDDSPFQDA